MYDEIALRHLHGTSQELRSEEWLHGLEKFIKVSIREG